MLRPQEATSHRVALAIDDASTAEAAARALKARGIVADRDSVERALGGDASAIGLAPCEPLTPAEAARLAPACARAARDGRPVAVLEAFPRATGERAVERAASAAYLRAHGAMVLHDPDAWLEALALVACFGVPPGPRTAVVAPENGWLWASATALANEAAIAGARSMAIAAELGRVGPTDAVLVDASVDAVTDPGRPWMVIPIVGRAEFLAGDHAPALVGLKPALTAVAAAGAAGVRAGAGLGPASADDAAELEADLERFQRQIDKLGDRAGDHETKVLLAAYGVTVTRQAVATTASAATRIAKKAGYPVEVKPWGPDCPTEPDGCPVERELYTAAEVRRAFVAVGAALGLEPEAPVIVRAAPPPGRELRVRVERVGALGWTLVAEVAGCRAPSPPRRRFGRSTPRTSPATWRRRAPASPRPITRGSPSSSAAPRTSRSPTRT